MNSPTKRGSRACTTRGWPLALLSFVFALLATRVVAAHEFRPALVHLVELEPGTFDMQVTLPETVPALELQVPAHCNEQIELHRLVCGERGLVGSLGLLGTAEWELDVVIEVEFVDGRKLRALVAAGEPPLVIGRQTRGSIFLAYLLLGIEHISFGLDHLLFVLGLWLVAAPPRGGRRMLVALTGFTLGHSLTLVGATSGWFTLPSAPVEAAIALSIVLLAREALAPEDQRDTLTWRWPGLVAAGFGLVHGFGFAGALADIGMAPSALPMSLFAFNLGVEVGQVALWLALLVVGVVAERSSAALRRSARTWVARAIGMLGLAWLIERTLALGG